MEFANMRSKWMQRRWQFSLRTLFVVVTSGAVALAVYDWHALRPERLVARYNQALEGQRYDDAEVIAYRFTRDYPSDPIGRQLVVQSRLIRRFLDGKAPINSGCSSSCGNGYIVDTELDKLFEDESR